MADEIHLLRPEGESRDAAVGALRACENVSGSRRNVRKLAHGITAMVREPLQMPDGNVGADHCSTSYSARKTVEGSMRKARVAGTSTAAPTTIT
jgi:hypothetical protein